jgi:hypothetical protein
VRVDSRGGDGQAGGMFLTTEFDEECGSLGCEVASE